MGSLVHSGVCGKATAVSEISFLLGLVVENCNCGSRRLKQGFLVLLQHSYCCSHVCFLLLQKEHKLARTRTSTSLFSRRFGSSYAARQQQRRLCSVPLPLFCPRGSCCCNSTASAYKLSARASGVTKRSSVARVSIVGTRGRNRAHL